MRPLNGLCKNATSVFRRRFTIRVEAAPPASTPKPGERERDNRHSFAVLLSEPNYRVTAGRRFALSMPAKHGRFNKAAAREKMGRTAASRPPRQVRFVRFVKFVLTV
jgi:hypothetical protein